MGAKNIYAEARGRGHAASSPGLGIQNFFKAY